MADGTSRRGGEASRRGEVLWPVERHAEMKSYGRLELHVEVRGFT